MAIDPSRQSRSRLPWVLAGVAVAMFGFGFAMSPIYDVFCDLTGLGGRGVKIETVQTEMTASDRTVKVRFDATVNSSLPWKFKAVETTSRITLGEMSEAFYLASNSSANPTIGQAIYTVTPPEASLYFVKAECFCFTEQPLAGNESREMPVRFYVKAGLPEHIKELTLSYTFFPHPDMNVVAHESHDAANKE